MRDSFTSSTSPSPAQRPPSRREILWDELERLHEHLLMDPPTATLTLEDLEADVERLRQLLAGIHESSDA